MAWYDRRAAALQRGVRTDEAQAGTYYEDDEIRRSIVHTRQDVVLLVSHLSSANQQLSSIKWAAWAGVILLAVIAFR